MNGNAFRAKADSVTELRTEIEYLHLFTKSIRNEDFYNASWLTQIWVDKCIISPKSSCSLSGYDFTLHVR